MRFFLSTLRAWSIRLTARFSGMGAKLLEITVNLPKSATSFFLIDNFCALLGLRLRLFQGAEEAADFFFGDDGMLVLATRESAHGELFVPETHLARYSHFNSIVADVNFAGTGGIEDAPDVVFAHSATDNDADSIARSVDQSLNRVQGLLGAGFSAGGEDAIRAGIDYLVNGHCGRRGQIRGHIECAVERDGHWPREINEFARSVHVDGSIGAEYSKDEAVGAELFGHEDVALHQFEFVRGVAKVAGARANHHLQVDSYCLSHRSDHSGAWGGATCGEVRAQLDARCAAALGGDGGLDRIKRDFQRGRRLHGVRW